MSSSNEPSKTSGQYHSLKGTAVEAVGNATGAQSWVDSGKTEHTEGEAQVTAARAKEYTEGTVDRLQGKKDAIVGAVTGDTAQQASGNLKKETGEAKQELNKPT